MSTAQQEVAEKALQLKQSSSPQKRGFSVEAVCGAYGICRSLAYVEIREGRLKARKAGRRTIIAAEDAEDWFAKLPRVKAACRGDAS
jgi:RNA polymerase-binding transcription factor DksA